MRATFRAGLLASAAALASAGAIGIAIDHTRSTRVREVIPGEIYRSGQLSPSGLEAAVDRWGLHSVLNLRGAAPGSPWYEAERNLATRRGLQHIDLRLSADRVPSRSELSELISLLDTAEKPLLVHCLGGQDRSGLAEALVILHAGGDLDAARRALRLTFAAVPFAESPLAKYVDQYAAWLAGAAISHDADNARQYAVSHYIPEIYGATLEPLSLPTSIAANRAYPARFRVANTSLEAWRLTERSSELGVHLGLRVERIAPTPISPCEVRGNTAEAFLPPGATVEIGMNLPVLREPGRYRFTFDMVNEAEAWFAARGASAAIVKEFDVAESALAPAAPIAADFVRCGDRDPSADPARAISDPRAP